MLFCLKTAYDYNIALLVKPRAHGHMYFNNYFVDNVMNIFLFILELGVMALLMKKQKMIGY